jgi:hypothetical protein
MAVISDAEPRRARRITGEYRFFLTMAIIMALTIVAGFATNLAAGRSSFSLPLIFHVHAAIFFGWVVLYVTQNALVATGSVALHRRLGWLAVAWVPAMVAMGIGITIYDVRRNGGPPFIDLNQFLFGNPFNILSFAVLAGAAIANRRRTDWHRRLMYCAIAYITGPGVGRILPLPLLIPWGFTIAVIGVPSIFPLAGIVYDWRSKGRIHPAWFWGMGVAVGAFLLANLIAYSPAGLAITHAAVAGTPGAARDIHAHFP